MLEQGWSTSSTLGFTRGVSEDARFAPVEPDIAGLAVTIDFHIESVPDSALTTDAPPASGRRIAPRHAAGWSFVKTTLHSRRPVFGSMSTGMPRARCTSTLLSL
jgi:hypothetical protein